MTKESKQFGDLLLNADLFEQHLIDLGVTDYSKQVAKENHHVIFGNLRGVKVRINVFFKGDGKTTLGFSSGFDRAVFDEVASHLAEKCRISNGSQRFELSLAKFPSASVDKLFSYLKYCSAEIVEDQRIGSYQQVRWKSKTREKMVIKVYDTGTIQFQGIHGFLANDVLDFLRNVLALDEVIQKQLEIFKVDLTVQQIKDELEGRIPDTCGYFDDAIRKQLSSALALSKLQIELEDYAAVCFPALKALEGVVKQLFLSTGIPVESHVGLGHYFKKTPPQISYCLDEVCQISFGAVKSDIVNNCFNYLYNNRNSLFHMAAVPASSRTIPSLPEAKAMVFEIFELIERSASKLIQSKS